MLFKGKLKLHSLRKGLEIFIRFSEICDPGFNSTSQICNSLRFTFTFSLDLALISFQPNLTSLITSSPLWPSHIALLEMPCSWHVFLLLCSFVHALVSQMPFLAFSTWQSSCSAQMSFPPSESHPSSRQNLLPLKNYQCSSHCVRAHTACVCWIYPVPAFVGPEEGKWFFWNGEK